MLIALLTGHQCRTIHKLDLALMHAKPTEQVYFCDWGKNLKNTRPGKH